MSNELTPGPGVTFTGERPSIDAPDLPQKPYEFVMETEVESLEKMHKVARHRKFEIHVDEPAHQGRRQLSAAAHLRGRRSRFLTTHPGVAVRDHDEDPNYESQGSGADPI